MKINTFRSEARGDRARITAMITWEDCNRPPRELFFETASRCVDNWSCNPEAFLVACLLPAWQHGETRIAIESTICPELQYGLESAIGLLNQWWPGRTPVRIECNESNENNTSNESNENNTSNGRSEQPATTSAKRAGMFLSGGIDSLATLRVNRLTYPHDHPQSLKIGVFVHGFDIGFTEEEPQYEWFVRACSALEPACRDCRLELVPVFTNVRHLDPDGQFWGKQFHGAALAAVGHALAHRLTSITIASGDNREMLPWGSHPALDPLYSSTKMRVRHDGIQYTRLEKTAIVAEWKVALNNLRVCYESFAGPLNCGHCEKCVRTMLHLLVCGKLADCGAFGIPDVTPAMLKSFRALSVNQEAYEVLLEPLAAMGRADLVAVARDLRRKPRSRFVHQTRLRRLAGQLDKQFLGGCITRVWRATHAKQN